jgi:hypothetical protein
MGRARLTRSKLEKAIAAVAAACGAVPQVVIEPDGTIRISPMDQAKPRPVDRPKPVRL